MRLLNIFTLEFREFFDHDVPEYAILSHRWTNDETSFKEFRKGLNRQSIGSQKVLEFCRLLKGEGEGEGVPVLMEIEPARASTITDEVSNDDYVTTPYSVEWCWIDTCCIDKRSSAELSEAINSMYEWYARSTCCVVYLADVHVRTGHQEFQDSNWFHRGWTLQELLAPRYLHFYTSTWRYIGDARTLQPYITAAGVKFDCMRSQQFRRLEYSAYNNGSGPQYRQHDSRPSIPSTLRMASQRTTTRKEDQAYCLLGLLDVSMPLLYGEGSKAWRRLLEEVMKKNDASMFDWRPLRGLQGTLLREEYLCAPMLPAIPSWYAHAQLLENSPYTPERQISFFFLNNLGLELRLRTPWVWSCYPPPTWKIGKRPLRIVSLREDLWRDGPPDVSELIEELLRGKVTILLRDTMESQDDHSTVTHFRWYFNDSEDGPLLMQYPPEIAMQRIPQPLTLAAFEIKGSIKLTL